MNRNKSQGWSHAKKSGHKNENLVANLLLNNFNYQKEFLNRLGIYNKKILSDTFNGNNEKKVNTILGHKAFSKTDLKLRLDDNSIINISLKKSYSGQVYLITKENFIKGFEILFSTIPENVKKGIYLFWSGNKDKDLSNIINLFNTDSKSKVIELKHNRLHSETLKNYNISIYNDLLNWFRDNIYELTLYCFSFGLSKDEKEYSKFIWYKNLISIDKTNIDEIFDIYKLADFCKLNKNSIEYSKLGSTIILPFGFVQWHKNSLQFHHNLNDINSIYKK